tara:strand:- start:294 stop:623 length:330 start_codon:yes stop_codon:yes gene_type:complete
MRGLTKGIAKPALLWGLHFTLIYALISAACAPRALLGQDHLLITAVVLTLAMAMVQIFWMWRGAHSGRRSKLNRDETALLRAGWWTGLISLIATLANLTPVLILPGCHG